MYFTAEGYKSIGRYDPATNQIDWWHGIGQNRTHMLVLSKDLKKIFTANGDAWRSLLFRHGLDHRGFWSGRLEGHRSSGEEMAEAIELSPDGREVSDSNQDRWGRLGH